MSEQEIDFSYSYKDIARLRGQRFFHSGAIGISMRLIPKTRNLKELNLPQILENFAAKKQGVLSGCRTGGTGKVKHLGGHD